MATDLYAVLCVSCALLLLFYAWKVVNIALIRPKRLEKLLRQQGFKGNSYRFLYGDLIESSKMIQEAKSKPINLHDDIKTRVISFFNATTKKYGKNSFFWLGPILTVILTDPELMKEVMIKHHVYQKPQFPNPLTKLLAQGLLTYETDKWAKHRKIINPAFHLDKLKMMVPALISCCEEMMGKWESRERSCELDVWPYLQNLSRDFLSRTAFGSSYEEGKRVFELQREQIELTVKAAQSIYILGWRFVPTKRNKRMKEIDRKVQSLIKGLIDGRVNAMKAGEACNDDLLGLLLESNHQEMLLNGDRSYGMNIDDVVAECKLFYTAGHETTSVLLVWTFFLLSLHPEWQKKARDEILQVFGSRLVPDFDGLNHLKIVTMILYEVLRLYPPTVALIRRITEDTKLGTLSLPKGVHVLLPTIMLHHSCEIWGEDAMEFKPDRFSEGVSIAQKGQGIYFPFGWGPRTCVGQTFAMLQVKLALTMILRRFSFKVSPSYKHAPHTVMILKPQHGVHLILSKI
ncbi:cytochrome P450 72A397-like [Henckelia pumila]|uniref:cytochrome P450 72A397-like n=1 Tax=Henckelia pumila TaxID=405737 RepID=UPI003C6DF9EC